MVFVYAIKIYISYLEEETDVYFALLTFLVFGVKIYIFILVNLEEPAEIYFALLLVSLIIQTLYLNPHTFWKINLYHFHHCM